MLRAALLNALMIASVALAGYAMGRLPMATPFAPAARPAQTIPFAAAYRTGLTMTRVGDVLELDGEIAPLDLVRFAEVLQEGGGAIRSVSLASSGGSLDASLAMASMIRQEGLDTFVPDGALCASSCPLILAAGVNRNVGSDAEIGVHQVAIPEEALTAQNHEALPGQFGVSAGQLAVSMISSHLDRMGVDPRVWLLGLATPPDHLRLLTREEMRLSRLVTGDR